VRPQADGDHRRPWIDWIHSNSDQAALIRDYTKWDDTPFSVPSALESILRADQITRTPPYAPTYVCLDVELQQQKLDEEVAIPDIERYLAPQPAAPAPSDVAEAADMLLNAKKPVILAGRTSRGEKDWNNRIALAEALGALVMTDLHWSASFPSDHPLHALEPRFRIHPHDPHIKAISEADVVLSLDWIDLGGLVKRAGGIDKVKGKFIHASVDSYIHRGWSKDYHILPAADLRIQATAEMTVEALLDEFERRGVKKHEGGPKIGIARELKDQAEPVASGEIGLRDLGLVWKEFRNTRDDISMISIPLGFPGDCVDIYSPMDYYGANGGGGIGAGPGIAVGAALALAGSGRIPVALVGDGDFLMGTSAIWSAAHFELPLMFVVSNNRSYYNDEAHQERMAMARERPAENKWIGLQIRGPEVDLISIAKGYGFDGHTVEDAKDLRAGLEKAAEVVANGGRYVLDVRVRPGYSD
jgi:thiamine pyrophosphate-dependent acetolactate synthase large subunit-like protein